MQLLNLYIYMYLKFVYIKLKPTHFLTELGGLKYWVFMKW